MNLLKRQTCGAIGIVFVAVCIYVAGDLSQYACSTGSAVVYCEYEKSGIIVGFSGDENYGGIYSLPNGSTVCDLFTRARVCDVGVFKESDLSGVLHAGDMVVCDRTRCSITIEDIAAHVRLALGMPIDLNKATFEELMLVTGIGHKTASKIINVREDEGKFSTVDALKRAGCIGKKRYDRIKDYLYIASSCP